MLRSLPQRNWQFVKLQHSFYYQYLGVFSFFKKTDNTHRANKTWVLILSTHKIIDSFVVVVFCVLPTILIKSQKYCIRHINMSWTHYTFRQIRLKSLDVLSIFWKICIVLEEKYNTLYDLFYLLVYDQTFQIILFECKYWEHQPFRNLKIRKEWDLKHSFFNTNVYINM